MGHPVPGLKYTKKKENKDIKVKVSYLVASGGAPREDKLYLGLVYYATYRSVNNRKVVSHDGDDFAPFVDPTIFIIMILLVVPLRLCRNATCSSTSKLLSAVYSASASQLAPKEMPLQEPPWISISEKTKFRAGSINPAILCPPKELLASTERTIVENAININRKGKVEDTEWRPIEVDLSKLHKYCLMLSKIRLTTLVVITTMGGYALAPAPFVLETFVLCSLGTGLVSAAANSINQFFEVPFDSQMSRTKNRVLVRGYLTPAHAVLFATLSSVAGISILYFHVNGLTAALGAANLVLYTLIYTPLKRVSILNTWVGSIVGAIPPLMGWAGCAGDILAPGAWIMSGMLYAWQFPHFNALSWNLRPDYSRAGYRMMAVTNPGLCRRTALRYTAVLMGLSYLAPVLEVTNWWFAVASTPLNAYFLYLAWQFNKKSDSASSRKLFRFSLVHLPALMLIMLVSKKYWASTNGKQDSIIHAETIQQTENNVVSILTRTLTPTGSSA